MTSFSNMALPALQPAPTGHLYLLPLAKFAYSRERRERIGPARWEHVSSENNDLFAIIEYFLDQDAQGAVRQNYHFKVRKGQNTLEEINLANIAHGAREDINNNQPPNADGRQRFRMAVKGSAISSPHPDNQRPAVAIRYPGQNEEVRQLQAWFSRPTDISHVFRVFNGLNMPYENVTPQPTQTSIHTSQTQPAPAPMISAPQPAVAVQHSLTTPNIPGFVHGVPQYISHNSQQGGYGSTTPATTAPIFQQAGYGLIVPAIAPPNSQSAQPTASFAATSSQNQRPASGISTFVPRASTVPSAGPSNLDLAMPPVRDLPFERKTRPLTANDPLPSSSMPSAGDAEDFNTTQQASKSQGKKRSAEEALDKARAPKKHNTIRGPLDAARGMGVNAFNPYTNAHTTNTTSTYNIDPALLDPNFGQPALYLPEDSTTTTSSSITPDSHDQSDQLSEEHATHPAILSSLSHNDRRRVLEDFAANNMDNPEFTGLVTTLNGVFQRHHML